MTKRFLFVSLLLSLFSVCSACSMAGFGLSIANGLAKTGEYTLAESVNYGPEIGNRLDIYRPLVEGEALSEKLPVVVFFYGGCWGACSSFSKDSYVFVAEALTSKRYVSVIVDYRRYPDVRFPVIIDDARLSVEWVKEHIGEYGGDAERIFLMGHSAGAHMAAMLTLNEQYLSTETYGRIKGFVGLAGPYDFLPLSPGYQQAVFGPEEKYPASQPINFVSGNEPPLKLMYGLGDNMVKVKNIKNLSAKVTAQGGQVETNYYEGVSHAGILAAMSIPLRGRSTITADIIDFLDRHSVQSLAQD
ncbi:MAG: alpha/beta hydrolase [Spongiibacteraceae bacterium]|nr:alpha/beta hydrolase [Spongiibacteraceae bacterium]